MREYHYAIILRRKRFRSSCSAKVGTRAPPPPQKKKKEEKRKNSTKGKGGGGLVEDKRREISFSLLLLQVSFSLLFQLSRRTGTETLVT